MPIINDYFLTSKTSRPGTKLLSVEAIVVHWTANTKPGANAKANANYFNNSGVQASSQFIVDSTGIYRLMEDDEVAYHCGGKSYKSIGESLKIDGKSPNYSTIGIEM
ncbi:MAG: N-acetylmuramoyl-L-alanine amidase, partial [Paraclostridium sp.]